MNTENDPADGAEMRAYQQALFKEWQTAIRCTLVGFASFIIGGIVIAFALESTSILPLLILFPYHYLLIAIAPFVTPFVAVPIALLSLVAQYPAYGIILFFGHKDRTFVRNAVGITLVHLLAMVSALVVAAATVTKRIVYPIVKIRTSSWYT